MNLGLWGSISPKTILGAIARGGGGAAAEIPWYQAGGAPAPVAAYKAIGAASAAESYVNLANPGTGDITTTTAPTFNTLRGWIFDNASNAFLDTNIEIAANTWTVIAMVNTIGQGGGTAGRLFAGNADDFFVIPYTADVCQFRNGGGTLTGIAVTLGVHSFAVANSDAYKDGVDVGNIALDAMPSGNLLFGNRSASARQLNGDGYFLAIYNTTLSAAQILAIHNAMAAIVGP